MRFPLCCFLMALAFLAGAFSGATSVNRRMKKGAENYLRCYHEKIMSKLPPGI
jgi:hypothetical protein